MTGQRLLLTGAKGFVGTQVLQHLPRDLEVHAVSRSAVVTGNTDVTWHRADLRDPAACRRLMADVCPDILVHCAWETEHGQFWEAASNADWLEAGRALFSEFVSAGGTRIVATGTCAEYVPSDGPLSETDDRGEPATRYGRAKLALLRHLETLPVSWAWVRIFNAYGAGEDARRFVPSVASALAEDRIAKCSSGRQVRDFIDVRDLGRAIAQLVQLDHEGPLNIGSGDPRPLAEIARALGRIAGKPNLIGLGALPDRPGEPPVLIPDTTRQATLSLMPQIPLEAGLADAWRYWFQQTDEDNQEAETT